MTATATPVPPPAPPFTPRRLALVGIGAGVAVAAFVALSELGRLIGDVAVSDQTFDPSTLYGPGVLLHPQLTSAAAPAVIAWRQAWENRIPGTVSVTVLLSSSLAFDVLFILGYTLALLALLNSRRYSPLWWCVVGVAFTDVAEDIIAGAVLLPAVAQDNPEAGLGPLWLLHFVSGTEEGHAGRSAR